MEYCLFTRYVEPSHLARYTCHDGSHFHISKKDLDALRRQSAVELVQAPRVYKLERCAIRGLSARMGEAIATMKNISLKAFLISEINRKPMDEPRDMPESVGRRIFRALEMP